MERNGKYGLCPIAGSLRDAAGVLGKYQNTNTEWKENNLPGAAVKASKSSRRESISQAALKRMQIRTRISVRVPARKRVRDRRRPTAIKAATSAIDAVFNPMD